MAGNTDSVARMNPRPARGQFPDCASLHLGYGATAMRLRPRKNARRTAGTRLNCAKRAERCLPLTFGGSPLWFAQPLGSPSGYMSNKITKLLIVVVPRRTAGDG